jgi:Flp pilus assembly protein TadD
MLDQVNVEDAIVAHREGRLQEAVRQYRQILGDTPQHPDVLHLLGVALGQLKEFDESVLVLARAIEIRPQDPLMRVHHGNALWGLGRGEQALESYDRALLLDPRSFEAHCNRGKVLNETDHPEEAIESFNKAVELAPQSADAYNNRGSAFAALGRNAEALESYDRALAINPELAEVCWNKSLVLLRAGRFCDGWDLHTACPQYLSPNAVRRFPAKPAWNGRESLAGKTIFLYADQGYGDVIQYCRYVPLLRRRGARVVVEVPKPLQSLIRSLDGVDEFTMPSTPGPPYDCHCPFSNLPGAFRADLNTIPREIPYLGGDAQSMQCWAQRLGPARALRAGLVWSGNASHRQDRNRSIPLAAFSTLKETGFEFVSLQTEVRESDLQSLSTVCAWHFGADLKDFSDTAAVISQLDVVISVDSAVAHLAGALGARIWVLLPSVPDWRWMLGREDSPWYPTARLFRQSVRARWDGPIDAVRQELHAMASGRRHEEKFVD